jgi:hypothetical protein
VTARSAHGQVRPADQIPPTEKPDTNEGDGLYTWKLKAILEERVADAETDGDGRVAGRELVVAAGRNSSNRQQVR